MKHNWIDTIDAVFFDFDGLLVDTERLHYAAFCAFCQQRGIELPWDFTTYCKIAHTRSYGSWLTLGEQYPETKQWQESFEELSFERNKLFLELLTSIKVDLMPGVKEVLALLAQVDKPRSVVTNSSYEMVEMIKAMHPELASIPLWLTRRDYAKGKPSPEGYLLAIDKLGVQGQRLIGFEDTPRGVDALTGATIPAVFINPVLCYQNDFQREAGGVTCCKSFNELLHSQKINP